MSGRVRHRLQNSQLNQHVLIKLIFEAVFCIKVKVQISLYSTVFYYGLQIFEQIRFFLRSVAFWGGHLYYAQIGRSGSFYRLHAFKNS